MNGERLAEYLGDIDERYVLEAAPGNRPANRKRWALGGLAAAAVLIVVVAGATGFWGEAESDPISPWTEPGANASWEIIGDMPGLMGPGEIGDAPGHIRWHGGVYCSHGTVVHEMPEGLELLGETDQVVRDGGIVPEDAGDLSANIDGYVYWFPGNENLIVFRYREWNVEEELGRQEPILIMLRERSEEEYREAGYAYCSLPELVDASYAIVEGAQARLEQSGGPDGSGEDVYAVQVTKLLYGSVGEQETIRVTVPVGSGALESSSEGSYLLFLRGNGDLTFRPVSEKQGVYPVVNKRVYVPVEDPGMGGILVAPYTHSVRAMALVREDIEKAAQGSTRP